MNSHVEFFIGMFGPNFFSIKANDLQSKEPVQIFCARIMIYKEKGRPKFLCARIMIYKENGRSKFLCEKTMIYKKIAGPNFCVQG